MTRILLLAALLLAFAGCVVPADDDGPPPLHEATPPCLEGVVAIIVYSPPGVVFVPDGREYEIHSVGWVEVGWEESDPIALSLQDLDGDTFTFPQIASWLAEAGFKDARQMPAAAPSPLILATRA